jgi:hypothetical protein
MESEVIFDRTGKGIKSDPKTVAEDVPSQEHNENWGISLCLLI